MFSTIIGKYHIWQGNNAILMSDENTKTLHSFGTADECINWLFMNGEKDAARVLNARIKEHA